MLDLHARRVGAQCRERRERGVNCRGRADAVQVEDRQGDSELDDAPDVVGVGRREREAHEFARGRSAVDGARARGVAEVREVAREEVGGEVSEARGQARGVGVELAPEVDAAVEGVVQFDDEAAPEVMLRAGVELVGLGDANRGVEAAREVSESRAELPDGGRVYGERVGEVEVGGDEGAAV